MVKTSLTLEEVKRIQVDILKFIDSVCEQNKLKYSIAYGTLLGAVRHKGYIPWDDDIDIILMRHDYEKLLDILYQRKDERYKIFSPRDVGYWYNYAKVSDLKTRIIEKNWPQYKGLGVNIDIFPLDYIPENDIEDFFEKACYYDRCVKECLTDNWYHHEKRYIQVLKYILRYNRVRKSKKKGEKYWKAQLEQMAKAIEKSKKIGCLIDGNHNIFDSNIMKSFCELDFEGERFDAIKEYDEHLRIIYGDYMKLPPEEQRKSNHDYTPYWAE